MKKFRRFKSPLRFDPAVSDYQKYVFEIAMLIGVVVAIVMVLPYRQVPVLLRGAYEPSPLQYDMDWSRLPQPFKAGWPMTFYTSHPVGGGSAYLSDWSFLPFVFDLLVIAALLAGLGSYFWPRRKRIRKVAKLKSKAVYALAAAGALVLLLGYLGLLVVAGRSDAVAAERLAEKGQVVRVAYVPHLLSKIFPEWLAESRLRIVAVALEDPEPGMLATALDQSELRSLRVRGERFDTALLRDLDDLPFLQDLSIQDAELNTGDLRALPDCGLLTDINLTGCTLPEGIIDDIAQTPRISRLSMLKTNVTFDDLNQRRLRRQIAELALSRPLAESRTITVKEWFRLRRLWFVSDSQQENPNVLTISASGLPQLKHIYLDPLQLVDFYGVNLPVFLGLRPAPAIDLNPADPSDLAVSVPDAARVAPAESLRPAVWTRNFELKEAGNMTGVALNARSINQIDIDGCDSLDTITMLGNSPDGAGSTTLAKDVRQNVVEQFERNPERLRLLDMMLSDLNLVSLTYNASLKHLDLTGSTLNLKGMSTLGRIDQLQTLNVTGLPLQPQTFRWINESFPRLQRLTVSSRFAEKVVFQDQQYLTGLTLDRYRPSRLRAVKLINLKSWVDPIVMADDAEGVRIKNLPSIRGIAIPKPCICDVTGVHGLEWFSSGGKNCRDELVREVLQAKDLERLALAYPTASAETLQAIAGLMRLRELNVAGAPVDDRFFVSWTVPASMRELIIDDCPITDAALASLVTHPYWESLSLARTNISQDAIRSLAGWSKLKQLRLAGLELDETTLRKLARIPNLEGLDLRDAALPGDAGEILAEYPSLRRVILSEDSMAAPQHDALMTAKPELQMDTQAPEWDLFHGGHGDSNSVADSAQQFRMPRLDPSSFRSAPSKLTKNLRR